uniref:Transporter n=1 Tax=Phallusia mammillata TaxID=59560 RepID=A0A6F9DT53_9ASCI|nr:sodium- and chloride-dependent glycine transporter 2-like [Phallusia mammillata]
MSSSYGDSNERERSTWPNKLEYQLSLFSYVLGLCTFWRFPYLAYENGGAPFVYIFLLLYTLVGIPLIFLEMAWGQYSNLAPLQAFKIIPAMQGIGVCMLVLSCGVVIYFGVASYYILLYLVSSFGNPLPWTTCGNSWNTPLCQTYLGAKCYESDSSDITFNDSLKIYGISHNESFEQVELCNYTSNGSQTSPSIEYWTKNLVKRDDVCQRFSNLAETFFGTETTDIIVLPVFILACSIALRFIVATISLAKHVRFTGKVAYLLSTIPFAVIIVLLVRSVTLTGSVKGLLYLFVPDNLAAFVAPKVWKDALSQVILTSLLSWGGLLTWSSYNRFYNKYHVDAAVIIPLIPVLSILSAVSMFAVVGHLSLVSDVEPHLAMRESIGPIAPLVAYTEALSHMWGSTLPWGIVFFATMFLSSISSILPAFECILSCLSDSVTTFRSLLLRNIAVILLLLTSFAAYYGVPCVLAGIGLQIIEFFDTFSLLFCSVLLIIAELLMLSYSFGFSLLGTNTKAMTGNSCLKSHFWSVMWGGISPIIVLAVLIYSIVGILQNGVISLSPILPPNLQSQWSTISGAVLVGFVFLVLVLIAVIRIFQSSGSCAEKLRNAFTPHLSRLSGNGTGDVSHTNGEIFMSDYTGHRERGIEVLIDEDIVTSV